LVNVDFADVQTVMKDAGAALMGIGIGQGPNRAIDAANAAITSPLLESPIQNAKRVVFNICGSGDLRLSEINAASEVIYRNCDPNANIIFGALVDPTMTDTVSITVLACDFEVVDSAKSTTTNAARSREVTTTNDRPQKVDTRINEDEVVNGRTTTTAESIIEPPQVLPKRGFRGPMDPNKSTENQGPSGLFRRLQRGK
jgi:cell division GTPase FtsZ